MFICKIDYLKYTGDSGKFVIYFGCKKNKIETIIIKY